MREVHSNGAIRLHHMIEGSKKVTVHSRVNHSADCTEDACFGLNASRPIAKGDLKWRDALLVAHRVNSNIGYRKSFLDNIL